MATFLFTDIEDSTRLWERHPDRMVHALARHDAVTREIVERHRGHVFKTMGDGACAVFEDAAPAVEAALELQRRIGSERFEVRPLKVRMALHAGQAEERGGDFFGPTLNRVARILSLGHGGQVLLSGAVEGRVERVPRAGRLRDLGEHRLRGLAEPERIFQLVHPDLPMEFAPLRDAFAVPTNLPRPWTSLLGRHDDLASVLDALRSGRLTTLVGTAGCGKSRLAVHAAGEALPDHPDGVWLVETADLDDEGRIADRIATRVDARTDSERNALDRVIDEVGSGRVLFVLDGCEHLLEDAARIAHALLTRCPGTTILATSREPLRAAGERIVSVPPLALPSASAPTVKDVERAPACALFLERAREAGRSWRLDEVSARRVARICRALDGVPLALELAAATTRRMDLEAIESALDRRFEVLRDGFRTAVTHHRSLRAALDWSHELLAEPERALFARLSVFRGGWSPETLEAAFDLGVEGDRALARLVDHSLVERRGDRFHFLESVRVFAAERLAEDPAAEREARERQARFVRDLATWSRDEIYRGDAGAVADRIEAELGNVRATLEWQRGVEGAAEDALRTAASLWPFCWMRGRLEEGRGWLEDALGHPDLGKVPEAARAQAHRAIGILCKESGRLDEALAHYETALDLLGEEDAEARAHLLHALGNVHRVRGDLTEARATYERAIALFEEVGAVAGVAGSRTGLGRVEEREGAFDRARGLHAEGLRGFRDVGDRRGEIVALEGLARARRGLGEPDAAHELLRECLRLCREQGDLHLAASALEGLAEVYLERGRPGRARRLLRISLEMTFREDARPAVYESLARLAALEADPDRRDRLLGAAYHWRTETGRDAERIDSAAFEEGRRMDLEAAVRFALER